MTTIRVGCSVASPSLPIRSTTFVPFVTVPTIAYCGGRPESPVMTKNWLPDVPGGSVAPFAIATVYLGYCAPAGGASRVV